jgi:hypothetical protein
MPALNYYPFTQCIWPGFCTYHKHHRVCSENCIRTQGCCFISSLSYQTSLHHAASKSKVNHLPLPVAFLSAALFFGIGLKWRVIAKLPDFIFYSLFLFSVFDGKSLGFIHKSGPHICSTRDFLYFSFWVFDMASDLTCLFTNVVSSSLYLSLHLLSSPPHCITTLFTVWPPQSSLFWHVTTSHSPRLCFSHSCLLAVLNTAYSSQAEVEIQQAELCQGTDK